MSGGGCLEGYRLGLMVMRAYVEGDEMELEENEIERLQNRISELEYENRNIKTEYHASFTALIMAAKTHDAVSGDWIKLAVDHLLRDDEDWWGHAMKQKEEEERVK